MSTHEPTLVTLADGREVPDDSPLWRDECLARARHVQTLRSLDLRGRRDYFVQVTQDEGETAANRLMAAYMADWEERREQARRATAEREAAMGGALQAHIEGRAR